MNEIKRSVIMDRVERIMSKLDLLDSAILDLTNKLTAMLAPEITETLEAKKYEMREKDVQDQSELCLSLGDLYNKAQCLVEKMDKLTTRVQN